jgi:hypothetical protein
LPGNCLHFAQQTAIDSLTDNDQRIRTQGFNIPAGSIPGANQFQYAISCLCRSAQEYLRTIGAVSNENKIHKSVVIISHSPIAANFMPYRQVGLTY